MSRCALYRHFDSEDVLLYVGISDSVESRTHSHARYSVWVRFAAYAEAVWLDSREDALVAEQLAIKTEHPLFNKQQSTVDNKQVFNYLLNRGAWDLAHLFVEGAEPSVTPDNQLVVLYTHVTASTKLRFEAEARRQGRTSSNLLRFMIMEWLTANMPAEVAS